jgi:tyrosyl-tRNA synthetase
MVVINCFNIMHQLYLAKIFCYTKIMELNENDELLTRGVANIIPGKDELKKLLKSDKKLNIYLGIDPTSTHIHLGHAVPLRKLQKLAELGHNVTFLIGDFTALVGDTSDKDSERPILTSEEIENNFQTYKKQAEKLVNFSKITIRRNSEWLSKLGYKEILQLTQRFSLNDFISRELIRKRLNEGKRVRLDETNYPLMQGYDSYFMDTDLQIGGTDQTFNMQAGRTLQKELRHKESYILATTFLEGTDGRKMSKSWGNAIWLDDEPSKMYRKVMAVVDNLIINYFILATNLSMDKIGEYEQKLKSGENPINIKKELAHLIVKELHTEQAAKEAQKEFEKTVQHKELPDEIDLLTIAVGGITASEVLIEGNFVESKSEAKRLIEQGGVSLNEKRVTDPDAKIEEGTLKVGKKRFAKIVIK